MKINYSRLEDSEEVIENLRQEISDKTKVGNYLNYLMISLRRKFLQIVFIFALLQNSIAAIAGILFVVEFVFLGTFYSRSTINYHVKIRTISMN